MTTTTAQSFCIEVGIRPDRTDVLAARLADEAREAGWDLVCGLQTRKGYSFRIHGDEDAARRLADELLSDRVMNTVRVYRPSDDPRGESERRLEVVRRPGVMDPAAQSIQRAATSLGLAVEDVRSWQLYMLPNGTGWAGDQLERVAEHADGLRVADVTRLYTTEAGNEDLLQRAVSVAALPESWRGYFEDQLEKLRG